jgi:hypothetical protein
MLGELVGSLYEYSIYYYYYHFGDEIDPSKESVKGFSLDKDDLNKIKVSHVHRSVNKNDYHMDLEGLLNHVILGKVLPKDYDHDKIIEGHKHLSTDDSTNDITDMTNDITGMTNDINVEYTLNNETYSLCITDVKKFRKLTKSSNQSYIPRKIIGAYFLLKDDTSFKDYEDNMLDVSEVIKKYNGPNGDFNENLVGISNKFKDVFFEYDLDKFKKLSICDMYGSDMIFDVSSDETLMWS